MPTLPISYFPGANLKLFGRIVAPIELRIKEVIKMNSAKINVLPRSQTNPQGKLRKKILNPVVCAVGAALGIFGGLSSLVAGLFCISIHVFVANDVLFDRVGTTLLILGIPLLLMGAVFLDEIEYK